jgi:3-dehydroquinate synthase
MVEETENSIKINLKRVVDNSYDVVFGANIFPRIAREMKELKPGHKFVIITDSIVKELHGQALYAELKNQGLNVHMLSFKSGELQKIRETKKEIEDKMLQLNLGRDTVVLALGGGVVGDLAGFVAATYTRGIPYVQIPTTVLAQADSSIGGKTAVDHPNAKNMIGAFKQPIRVYVDVATIKTLNEDECKNGMAETIKHGIIHNKDFFDYLMNNINLLLERNPAALIHIAKQNCIIKGNIVEQDPHENGIRRILNYGHTVGHAIEKLSKYKLSHGKCVSIGMMAAGRIAIALKTGFTEEDLKMQGTLLKEFCLPLVIPAEISNESIIETTVLDKKTKDGMARYVLPSKIGAMCEFNKEWATFVDNNIVMDALNQTR